MTGWHGVLDKGTAIYRIEQRFGSIQDRLTAIRPWGSLRRENGWGMSCCRSPKFGMIDDLPSLHVLLLCLPWYPEYVAVYVQEKTNTHGTEPAKTEDYIYVNLLHGWSGSLEPAHQSKQQQQHGPEMRNRSSHSNPDNRLVLRSPHGNIFVLR